MLFVSHESKLYGAPLSLLYMIQWFASRADVQVATIGSGGLVDRLRRDGMDVAVLPAPHGYGTGQVARALGALRRQLGKGANALQLARLARDGAADLVYVNSVSRLTNVVGAWLSGKAVVVHVREVENYLEPRSPLRRLLLRQILRLADRFVADSEASRQVLKRVVPGADARVVHNGVDPKAIASSGGERDAARKRLGLDPDRTVIGFVGKQSVRKGFDTFREAAARVGTGEEPVQFLVIGDRHESLPDRGAEPPDVIEVPFIDNVNEVYTAMDIFVMASRQEPFARVNLEAAAAGCAVVATAVDGNLELFTHQHDALLVPPGDPEAMAGAIQRLIGDPELREQLGRAAQQLVRERYTLEICHQKVLESIEDLLPTNARDNLSIMRPDDDA